jgi:hypothetical protein
MRCALSFCSLTVGLCLWAGSAAEAQYPQYRRSELATGERYHVELSYGLWDPSPEVSIASESLGIPGSTIDLVDDFGIESRRLPEFRAILRPAQKHKFRIGYIPIKYEVESAVLRRDIIFNGIRFNVGLPVNAEARWDTWRFGYEYDFLYRDRGFLGVVVEAKYTRASVELDSPIASEFARVSAPIPTIGVAGRGYIFRNLSVSGDFTLFRLPNGEDDDYKGNYYDFDVYSTLNFTNNVGVQFGYRTLDVGYTVDFDFGDLNMQGFYFMGVVRF